MPVPARLTVSKHPVLTQIAAGRADAVEECLHRFSGPVWTLARRHSPTEQDAEDAVQEIFLDIWRSAARYRSDAGSELTFVMTIARRRLIDRHRQRGRIPRIDSATEPDQVGLEVSPTPAETAEELALAREALDALRPEQRQVLELALIRGCSHQQVANCTGMPLGTVKSHARRGLQRVRDMLGVKAESGGIR